MTRTYLYRWMMALTAGLLMTSTSFAETLIFYAPHSDEPPVIFDSDNPGRFAASDSPHDTYNRGTRGSITWAVTYDDVTGASGVGFDDAAEGAIRRANVVAVLAYIDSTLNATLPVTIEIRFGASETDGSGSLASAGTLFFISSVFSPGFAATHIQSGVDPSISNIDISATFDFGWTWNSDHTVAPTGGQLDLYSVMLHEMTHGLGVLSLVNAAGVSSLTPNTNPGPFSTMNENMHLGTGGTSPLFTNSPAPAQFIGVPANLTSNNVFSNATQATAALGSNPRIFAPGTFSQGSSMSHWDPSVSAVMNPSIGSGVSKRVFSDFEIAFFRDLGYAGASGNILPTLQFTQGQFQVFEDDGTATISVTLNPASTAGSVSVTYASASGGSNPATNGADYTDVGGTLTWLINESGTRTFTIPLLTDVPVEDNETVKLTISSPTGDGVLGTPSTALLIIVDPANLPLSKGQIALLLMGIVLAASLVIRRTIRQH